MAVWQKESPSIRIRIALMLIAGRNNDSNVLVRIYKNNGKDIVLMNIPMNENGGGMGRCL